jgi:hypothetical protein
MVGALEEANTRETTLVHAVKRRLHQPAADPKILHLRVHGDRPQACDWGPLVEEVTANDRAIQFGDDAKEPWMRQQHCHEIRRHIHRGKVGGKIVFGGNGSKRLEADSTTRLCVCHILSSRVGLTIRTRATRPSGPPAAATSAGSSGRGPWRS